MDKNRYKLIRDGYFDKLPDYSKAPFLKIKNKNIVYPIVELQLSLPGFEERVGGLRFRLGRFFEVLAQGIYGGKIGKFHEIFSELDEENNMRSEPDIIHQKRNILREIKATSIRDSLKLRDDQMKNYLDLQIEDNLSKSPIIKQMRYNFSKPPMIKFEVFRHKVKGLLEIFNEGGLEGVIKELTEGTRAMISFPFGVMYRIYQANISFTGRYEGETFHSLTRFHAEGLNYLLSEPEEAFKEMGFNPELFEFKKKRFPKNVTINKRKITPFPILIINEKDPAAELEKLEEIYYSDVPF